MEVLQASVSWVCKRITAKLAQLLGVRCQLGQMPTGGSRYCWPSWDRVCGRASARDCCFQANHPNEVSERCGCNRCMGGGGLHLGLILQMRKWRLSKDR